MQLSCSCRHSVFTALGVILWHWVGVYPAGVWGHSKGYGQELVRIEDRRSRREWRPGASEGQCNKLQAVSLEIRKHTSIKWKNAQHYIARGAVYLRSCRFMWRVIVVQSIRGMYSNCFETRIQATIWVSMGTSRHVVLGVYLFAGIFGCRARYNFFVHQYD